MLFHIAQINMHYKINVIHITYRKGTTSMFWRYCKIVQHCQGNQGRWRKCNFLKWGWYVSRKCLVQSVQMESDRSVHKLFEFYSFCKYIAREGNQVKLNNFLPFYSTWYKEFKFVVLLIAVSRKSWVWWQDIWIFAIRWKYHISYGVCKLWFWKLS